MGPTKIQSGYYDLYHCRLVRRKSHIELDVLCPFVPMHGPTICIVGVDVGQAQALVPELPRLAGE